MRLFLALCRYYRALADFADANSHGSHCGGSAVGSLSTGAGDLAGIEASP